MEYMDVFIAYHGTYDSNGSARMAGELYDYLQKQGIRCYFYPDKGGAYFSRTPIDVSSSRNFLFVCNGNLDLNPDGTIASNGVDQEVTSFWNLVYDRERNKQDARVYCYGDFDAARANRMHVLFRGVDHFDEKNYPNRQKAFEAVRDWLLESRMKDMEKQQNQQDNCLNPGDINIQTEPGSLKYCPHCHKPVSPGNKYCSWCGGKIQEEPEQVQPVQANRSMQSGCVNQAEQSSKSVQPVLSAQPASADIAAAPLKKTSGKKWIGIACAVCIALVAVIGGFLYINSSDNTATAYTAGTYFTYSAMPVREDADRESEQIDFVKGGSIVYLGSVAATDDGEVWGEQDSNGSGKWICIQDSTKNYLEDIDYQSNDNEGSGVYFLCSEMPVRQTPGRDGEYISTLYPGNRVYIADTQSIDLNNGLWGELNREGSGKWVCLQEDGVIYLQKYISALDTSNSESINGYLPGTYYLTQDMNIYDTASTYGTVLDSKKAGSIVQIGSLMQDLEAGWIWGELGEAGSSKWIGINNTDNWFFLEPVVIAGSEEK